MISCRLREHHTSQGNPMNDHELLTEAIRVAKAYLGELLNPRSLSATERDLRNQEADRVQKYIQDLEQRLEPPASPT